MSRQQSEMFSAEMQPYVPQSQRASKTKIGATVPGGPRPLVRGPPRTGKPGHAPTHAPTHRPTDPRKGRPVLLRIEETAPTIESILLSTTVGSRSPPYIAQPFAVAAPRILPRGQTCRTGQLDYSYIHIGHSGRKCKDYLRGLHMFYTYPTILIFPSRAVYTYLL